MTKNELRLKQASIRDTQRKRLDDLHSIMHEYQRNEMRKDNGAHIPDKIQSDMIREAHDLIHKFMWGFDEAVLIHERIAQLDGRDPAEVASSLWKVNSM